MNTEKNVIRRPFAEALAEYGRYLHGEERSVNTIAKYVRDLRAFFAFLKERELDKENVLLWKDYLMQRYAPASVNSMLAAVNSFLEWSGMRQMKVRPVKIQREIFARPERELTREEYLRLVEAAAKSGQQRLSVLLQTICATGIRVSELRFITVEAARSGRAEVTCKGKNRTVFLPTALSSLLLRFCRQQGIGEGMVFRTGGGKPLDRSNIWKEMKVLCEKAGVAPEKVFPHNLRHLFARTYYRMEKDLSRLADLLGHSNVTTTRIYTMESGSEHARSLERMDLIIAGT